MPNEIKERLITASSEDFAKANMKTSDSDNTFSKITITGNHSIPGSIR
jgi:hypothetical protein